MNFNKHYELEGHHAFLSASKYHWTNYTPEKLEQAYSRYQMAQHGTRLHAFASEAILLGIKMPRSKKTINMYINDAIGFRMTPEQPLFYSPNCFGTADAISFRNAFLRIHDLKSGESPTNIRQLEIYDALFCLEYRVEPQDIQHELRIYQSDEVVVHEPFPEDIRSIMDTIIEFDQQIENMKIGE